jgi:hypothetical protein
MGERAAVAPTALPRAGQRHAGTLQAAESADSAASHPRR